MKEPHQRSLLVYVGGAYSADNVIDVFGNMRRGFDLAKKVLDAGHYPFVPWLDHVMHLQHEISLKTCYAWSLAFLRRCDCAIFVTKGLSASRGSQSEMVAASQSGIPVFFSVGELVDYAESLDDN